LSGRDAYLVYFGNKLAHWQRELRR
jgi:hypothetical protein